MKPWFCIWNRFLCPRQPLPCGEDFSHGGDDDGGRGNDDDGGGGDNGGGNDGDVDGDGGQPLPQSCFLVGEW